MANQNLPSNHIHGKPVRPIETVYNGYRFRSRLEARWAVFLNALGLDYEYEKEGFETKYGRYLPDFWLPAQQSWLEIKPYPTDPTEYDDVAINKLGAILAVGQSGLLVEGQPLKYRAIEIIRMESHTRYLSGENTLDLSFPTNALYARTDWGYYKKIGLAAGAAMKARFEHGEKP